MTEQLSLSDTKSIVDAINTLCGYVQVDLQSGWRLTREDIPITEIIPDVVSTWPKGETNDKGHLAWGSGREVRIFAQVIKIPTDLQGYQLRGLIARVGLVWWADSAQVYVNGKLAAEGDLFDFAPRILLTENAIPGEEFWVVVRLVSPGHDGGALMRSQLIFESADPRSPEPSLIATEVAVLQGYLQQFAPHLLPSLASAIAGFDLDPTSGFFPQTLRELRNSLIPYKIEPMDGKIYLTGHAHLDMAWLWQVAETWRAAENTFKSVLALQQDYPNLIFSHSTPALYAWIEQNRPDLFTQIQTQVKEGKWEVTGGFWVEPELNIIAGESIVRQLLYGQKYTQAKFGHIATVVWVPDSFGFCWTLPQFMVQAGVEFFVTQKLRWNDTTKFPYGIFKWRSPDGSEITSYMSAPIGEGIEPVKLAAYHQEWQTQTGIKDALWLTGIGDHGGGPTRDMLEVAARWNNSPVFPEMTFTTVENYLRQILSQPATSPLPVWNDEIYLEFHRGCYTTHADQKRLNRRCETLLFTAELFASLSTILTSSNYPQTPLETAWKKLLFNQFHDILPGSSIPEVYSDAEPEWEAIQSIGNQVLHQALHQLYHHIPLPPPPTTDAIAIILFNPLNWTRSEVVQISLPDHIHHPCISTTDGQTLPIQQQNPHQVHFIAPDIPPIGYKILWLSPGQPPTTISPPSEFILENSYLRVTVDPETGDLTSIFDLVNHQEILSAPGNQLQAFVDAGQYWDAWNIDPNYHHHPLPPPQLQSISWSAWGPVQNTIRVIRKIGTSEFCQDYTLTANSPILKIHTTVDWKERHVLVKAAFPLTISNNFATYEIPCGTIQRSTNPQTPQEQAKWEVPALRWADISQINYGVSLLNDCKYGYDATPNQLRITLLRGSTWPNPHADLGLNEFTYAIYPHPYSWEQANTVHRGYELNTPLSVLIGETPSSHPPDSTTNTPPDSQSFIQLSAENIVIMAFKPADFSVDSTNKFILRCYECHNQTSNLKITNNLGLTCTQTVDILERPTSTPEFSSLQQNLTIQPGKIYNLELQGKPSPI